MGLAEQLAIDPEEMSWRDWAACNGILETITEEDKDHPFFEKYEGDIAYAKSIDQTCFGCPVQRACGNYGNQNKLEGVWGGVYLNTQGNPDRKRNEHKSDAEWKQLKEVFDWL